MTKDAQLEWLRCGPGRGALVTSRTHEPEPRAESVSKSFGIISDGLIDSNEWVLWAETAPFPTPLYARYPAQSRRSANSRLPPNCDITCGAANV